MLASATAWIDEVKTVPGLTRLLIERGAQIVAVILLLALAIDSALFLTHWLAQATALPPPGAAGSVAPPRPRSNPTLEVATIVRAHLFGQAAVVNSTDAPATTMPLVLAGVIADKDPAKGQAIIGENASAAKLYAVGAAIPGGARLHAVYSQRVLIERNGGLEALMLPRTAAARPGPMTAPAPALLRGGSERDNSTLLAGLVRMQPVFNQGKLTGYRIFPGGGRGTAAFTQLGLRAGDLIQAINGTPLDDAARAMEVMQTLSSAATATVTVSRNGQAQELNLNLATLNLQPDAADGGAAAPAGEAPAVTAPVRGHFNAAVPSPAPPAATPPADLEPGATAPASPINDRER
jgi:general secretion pathway protein C